jgi:hypothetical protein
LTEDLRVAVDLGEGLLGPARPYGNEPVPDPHIGDIPDPGMRFPRKIPGLPIVRGLALARSTVVVPYRTREPGTVDAEDRLQPSNGSVRDREEARQCHDHLGAGVGALHGLVGEAGGEAEFEDAELALGRAVRRTPTTLPEERLQPIG